MVRITGALLFIFCSFVLSEFGHFVRAVERADQVRVYIGTYTGKGSDGIYVADFNTASGELSKPRLAARAENPSFLAVHPSGKFLYAANEINKFQGKDTGGVSAFTIDAATGDLTILNQLASGGGAPCHISLDPSASVLLSANYGGGNIAAFLLAPDGKLKSRTAFIQHEGKSANPQRQEAPHAHAINCDPSGKFVFANDLGIDKVMIYRLDAAKGTLTASDPPALTIKAGSGPRHLAIKDKNVYVLNELSSTVTIFDFDFNSGKATEVQTISTLPDGSSGDSWCAEIVIHPNGRFVYASNRGHDSLAIFEREAGGKLVAKGHVKTGFKTPRNFAIDPTEGFCLVGSQSTNEVFVHKVDDKAGVMSLVGAPVKVGSPVCIRFAPVGK
jgi:6-phosphogluconolactonase